MTMLGPRKREREVREEIFPPVRAMYMYVRCTGMGGGITHPDTWYTLVAFNPIKL